MKARAINKFYSMDGKACITLEIADKSFLNNPLLDGSDIDVKIDKMRRKRSNNANAYLWTLCDRIAQEVGTTKEEVCRQAVRHVGVWKQFPPMPEKDARTLRHAWERLGVGWITEDVETWGDQVVIRCYYGTSEYDTKQMARVIDDLTFEAKELNIPTKEDDEIQRMLKEHEKRYSKRA